MKLHRMLAVAAFALCAASVQAQIAGSDHIPTSGGPVDIIPIHHASLMLTWKGEHILIDPAPVDNGAQGAAAAAPYKALPQPDFILITHIHGDHFSVPILQAVSGPNTVILAPQNVRDA